MIKSVDFAKKNNISKFAINCKKFKYFTLNNFKRVYKRFIRRKNDVIKFYGIVDIEAACEVFYKQMKLSNIAVFKDENC